MLKVVNKNGILLKYDYKGVKNNLRHSIISKHWEYANEEELEEIKVYADKNLLIGLLTVASGQGGVIFVYDMEKKELIHISEGSYAVDVKQRDNNLFVLHYVSNWGSKSNFMVSKTELGIMDPWNEVDVVLKDLEIDEDKWNGSVDSIVMSFGNAVQINVSGEEYSYTI